MAMSNVPEGAAGLPPRSKVPEYDAAGHQFTWELLQELMRAKDPLLERIGRQPTDHVSTEASAPGTSAVGMSRPPARIETSFSDRWDTILNMDFDGFAEMMDDAAKQSLDSFMPQVFRQLEEITKTAGTTVDARGKPFTVDLFLDGLEQMEIDFTDDGQPVLPTMIVGPELFATIAALPPPTEEQLARNKRILEDKKKAFDAHRRVRKLD